ncbi:hypothetical protein BKA65DRAFT_475306 [Rhexocercosporidium sp. MPI-PUGE-AT-0058]|nr:hypothetical protein BKA65DRAFT_475306 [Rhexocercosporidium sp. MPI-PUGE-AT-0058]
MARKAMMKAKLPQLNAMSPNTCRTLILHPTTRMGMECANLSVDEIEACLIIMEIARSNEFDRSKSLETFTLFPKLPMELRLIIFRYAVSNLPGRNVFKRTYFCQPHLPLKHHMYRCDPPLMHVNRESRLVTQQVYHTFNLSIQEDNGRAIVLSALCFNPEIDTLLSFGAQVNGFWSYESAISYPRQIRETVRHLVVPFGAELNISLEPIFWITPDEQGTWLPTALYRTQLILSTVKFLDSFPALETLTLAVCPYEMAFVPKVVPISLIDAQLLVPSSWSSWTMAIDFAKAKYPRWAYLAVKHAMIVKE